MFWMYVAGLPGYALSMLVWYSIGRKRGRLDTRRPDYTCSCKHAFGAHDRQTGRCHAGVRVESKYSEYGDPIAWKYVDCSCSAYAGDVPVEYMLPGPLILPTNEPDVRS